MDDTFASLRHLLATGDTWALTDADIAQAISAPDRLTKAENAEIHKLSDQRKARAAYNDEVTAKLLAQLQSDQIELLFMCRDLVTSIEPEETRTGCHDPAHFAYPLFCKAGRIRLTTLHRSIDDVAAQIADLEARGTGLRMAGQDGIVVERQMDGAGVETLFADGEWRAPA